ncbi:MAG: tripartite tricarboxylate transporter substrate binding protein [Rhodocyclaceae bacterium]|jgi:tripartite-type tricarboxylate transporter receptor subunit TctC|nr:tripartite tricarboxylate transporter substrate binding protein [Rhodocyclaceae bacterium]MCE2980544.1 tripartite tricarboxylate transporter substrate binding protein [Betaproteobacteria bacterium]MCA3074274.1 tripartite tricarboxylate transporter substrate binding protein [Rhodocyclaceae bacterium]MCA3090236.1 tripartite tricarboxylate transporter substrate binding protein [Rhodocyclaceae bacterium]MCA3098875.1 tripartite tricarboxylate transporter substrate binding protein [Rhodocyclaceae 
MIESSVDAAAKLGALVFGAAALMLGAAESRAQAWPAKPIRMIAPFPPGGTSDVIGRVVGGKLQEVLGQNVLVENRAGAGGSLGTEVAARAPADGYTILVGNASPISINPLLVKYQYDTLRDFASVTLVARSPQLLVVHPTLPIKTVKDLIPFMKANSGKVNYGSSGIGTLAHLAAEQFKTMTKTDITHITYKGSILVVLDMVAGNIPLAWSDMAPALTQVKAGKLRAVAVTSAKPSPLLPDVPTMASVLPGFDMVNWWGLFVPAGTPQPVIGRLNSELVKIMRSTDVVDRFAGLGVESLSSTPEELTALVKAEIASFGNLIRAANIKAD